MPLSDGALNALGSLASAGVSAGGNLLTSSINSARSYKYAIKTMQAQDALNRDTYAWTGFNGPGIARQGYERAGYNPLLALGSNLTPSGSVYSGAGINSDSDTGSQAVASALDAMRLRNENKLNKSQVKLNQSQEDLNTQLTYKTFADELKARQEARVASATEAKIYNDIDWDNILHDAEFKQIMANIKFTNERARGFSASSSESKKYGGGAFSVKGDYGSSKSSSKSW